MILRTTFFDNVTDEDIINFAKEHLNLFAPEVSKLQTSHGEEYYHIDGIRFTKNGKSERVQINLSYFKPVIIRKDVTGDISMLGENKAELESNLKAYKQYIRMMSEKNFGKVTELGQYDDLAVSLYNLIIDKIISMDHERQA